MFQTNMLSCDDTWKSATSTLLLKKAVQLCHILAASLSRKFLGHFFCGHKPDNQNSRRVIAASDLCIHSQSLNQTTCLSDCPISAPLLIFVFIGRPPDTNIPLLIANVATGKNRFWVSSGVGNASFSHKEKKAEK